MRESTDELELKERLELIESMLAAGRRKTENWGWTFVLWGVAYYVAIAWAKWGSASLAWPVTMFGACLLTLAIAAFKKKHEPNTTIGRAIGAVWSSVGISMLLIFSALGMTNRMDQHAFVAIVASMLGIANGASGIILKWKAQIGCAVIWWASSVAACFGTATQLEVVFLSALFICQIVFGLYTMICESKRRRGAVHA